MRVKPQYNRDVSANALLQQIDQHPDLPPGTAMHELDEVKKIHRSFWKRLKRALVKSNPNDQRTFADRWKASKVFGRAKPDLADLIEQFQEQIRKPWQDG